MRTSPMNWFVESLINETDNASSFPTTTLETKQDQHRIRRQDGVSRSITLEQ